MLGFDDELNLVVIRTEIKEVEEIEVEEKEIPEGWYKYNEEIVFKEIEW